MLSFIRNDMTQQINFVILLFFFFLADGRNAILEIDKFSFINFFKKFIFEISAILKSISTDGAEIVRGSSKRLTYFCMQMSRQSVLLFFYQNGIPKPKYIEKADFKGFTYTVFFST